MVAPLRLRAAQLLLCACALSLLAVPALAFTPQWRVKEASARYKADPEGHKLLGIVAPPDPDDEDCHADHSATVWMCISTVLVLGMSPALSLFEAGMLRSKSTVSLITQIFAGVITLSVMWMCFGYSLTFGPSQGGFIGNLDHAFFIGVSYYDCSEHASQIPAALFAMFQMMFAVITPLLMTGAFAERLKFKSYMLLVVLWEIVVYYPLAHWIWGGGWLGKWGTLDFAGGIVIHTSAGMGSLVAALYLGRRKHFFDFMGEFPPSNLPLAATGTALLWIGWFGFNGGSSLGAGHVAVSAITSTQIGCSCSAFMWLVLSWWKEKPTSVALMNGALAGLAGITPASGYINTPATILLGCIFGVASFYSIVMMKHHLHVDDALDVSSVHGLTGVLGALGLGLFAQLRIDPSGADGAFYGNGMQFVYQLVGVLLTAAYAGFWTLVLLKFLDVIHGGIRVTEDEEEVGVDWAEHHEIAYHKLHVLEDASIADEPLYHGQNGTMVHNAPDQHSLDSNTAYDQPKVNSSIANLNRPLMEESITDVSLIGSSGSGSMPIRVERPASPFTRLSVPTTHSYRRSSPHLGPGFLEGSNETSHGSVH